MKRSLIIIATIYLKMISDEPVDMANRFNELDDKVYVQFSEDVAEIIRQVVSNHEHVMSNRKDCTVKIEVEAHLKGGKK